MDLLLGSQFVSTCFSLRLLMSRHLLVHDFNIGRAWRCAALGMDILRITHLIPFVSLYSCIFSLFCNIDGSHPWSAACKDLLLPPLVDVSSSSGSCFQYRESVALCRPRHGHSPDNSPHSFLGRILAPTLWFALSMDLFLGSQDVSTCFSLRLLMSRPSCGS